MQGSRRLPLGRDQLTASEDRLFNGLTRRGVPNRAFAGNPLQSRRGRDQLTVVGFAPETKPVYAGRPAAGCAPG